MIIFVTRSIIIDYILRSQLTARRCEQCGQPLPQSYTPPADEDWTTGIFGCAEDNESCKLHFCNNNCIK